MALNTPGHMDQEVVMLEEEASTPSPFTPDQEARLREIVRDEIARQLAAFGTLNETREKAQRKNTDILHDPIAPNLS